jgi:hypothetical protein
MVIFNPQSSIYQSSIQSIFNPPFDLDATPMTTHFITAELDLTNQSTDLQDAIESQLNKQGEPLRWSITAVEDHIAQVEAVVLKDLDPQQVG